MIVGIDVDDVLYQTSRMIRQLTPNILDKMGITYAVNETAYLFKDVYGLTDEQCAAVGCKLEWFSVKYIDITAVHALKRLKQVQPDIDLQIVTWRPEQDTLPITQLLKQYFYLDIPVIHCLADGTSKATFCDDNGISLMLDDYESVIRDFTPANKCKGVLVATSEHVLHNKTFADEYHTVLTDWDDLNNLCLSVKNA